MERRPADPIDWGRTAQKIIAFERVDDHIVFRDQRALENQLDQLPDTQWKVIGQSRDGRDLFGVEFGSGDTTISVIGGSHADEPVGPMTAQALPLILHTHFPEALKKFRFRVVPQMNPDGADANKHWFTNPLDFGTYIEHVIRELPGEDIEFGFGDEHWTRPECKAVMEFLREEKPYRAHFSLHGMGFAEGAWFLLCKEWRQQIGTLMERIKALCNNLNVPLHDIDRKGEKGFTRIERGFCTTPTSTAMKEFFARQGDEKTMKKFQPSSMEFVQSLGGNPLCVVSELPLFEIGRKSPSLDEPVYVAFREEAMALRTQSPAALPAAAANLAQRYGLKPMPLGLQVRLQTGLILAVLASLKDDHN